MSSVAVRNLMPKFEMVRNRHARAAARSSKDAGETPLFVLPETLPPEWIDIVQSIQTDLTEVKSRFKQLQQLHAARLRVTFAGDKEADQERQIDVHTQEISRLFHGVQNKLAKIATVGNDEGTKLAREERVIRFNVMRSLASDIQDISTKFRQAQKDFLIRMEGQKQIGAEFFATQDEGKMSLREVLDREVPPEQLKALAMVDRVEQDRYNEILNLVKSVNDLSLLFKQLNTLVIEQGTVLDRIDVNIEKTKEHVTQANKKLKEAEKESRSPKMLMCGGILVLMIIILAIILAQR